MTTRVATAILLTLASATAVAAQEPVDTVPGAAADRTPQSAESAVLGVPVDSVDVGPAPDLEAALDRLAERLGALADRVANDPELRSSALRTAESLLDVTEVVVARQSELLIEVLRKASEEISETARRSGESRAEGGDATTRRR